MNLLSSLIEVRKEEQRLLTLIEFNKQLHKEADEVLNSIETFVLGTTAKEYVQRTDNLDIPTLVDLPPTFNYPSPRSGDSLNTQIKGLNETEGKKVEARTSKKRVSEGDKSRKTQSLLISKEKKIKRKLRINIDPEGNAEAEITNLAVFFLPFQEPSSFTEGKMDLEEGQVSNFYKSDRVLKAYQIGVDKKIELLSKTPTGRISTEKLTSSGTKGKLVICRFNTSSVPNSPN